MTDFDPSRHMGSKYGFGNEKFRMKRRLLAAGRRDYFWDRLVKRMHSRCVFMSANKKRIRTETRAGLCENYHLRTCK